MNKTPQRVKLLDTFMVFLMVVGALQFLYVVLVGNFVRTHHHSCIAKASKRSLSILRGADELPLAAMISSAY